MEALVYKNPLEKKGKCAKWLNDLRNSSGAYIIRGKSSHKILYVGESHTGNLAKTIKRHFYSWDDSDGRDHFIIEPEDVEIAVRVTPPNSAKGAQNNLIKRLEPKYNVAGIPRNDPIPF